MSRFSRIFSFFQDKNFKSFNSSTDKYINRNKIFSNTIDKCGCNGCANCNKLFDCYKYVFGLFIGGSLGFFYGYNYNKKYIG